MCYNTLYACYVFLPEFNILFYYYYLSRYILIYNDDSYTVKAIKIKFLNIFPATTLLFLKAKTTSTTPELSIISINNEIIHQLTGFETRSSVVIGGANHYDNNNNNAVQYSFLHWKFIVH